MSTSTSTAVVCAGLTFTWPDGTSALTDIDTAFGAGRTGLIGRNGTGKSTLLRLISGDLRPTTGSISVNGTVAHLAQDLPLRSTRTDVADLLGIAGRHTALRAIEAGDTAPRHFAALGEDWDVDERAHHVLDRLGVRPARGAGDVLDRPVATLSGGEAMLAAIAGLLLSAPDITLLDEPTNNLDERARGLLYTALETWPGVVIVASHDRELLERMSETVELRTGAARVFGGPFSRYEQIMADEQQTAQRLVRAAEGKLTREKRQWEQAQVKLARRKKFADRAEREKRVPKSVAHGRKRTAQVSAGKYRGLHADRLEAARSALTEAEEAVRDDDEIRVDLPETAVPAGKDVLRVGELVVRGPEHIALTGPNGSGKTTLLEAIAGLRTHPAGRIDAPTVAIGYLPQRLDRLDDSLSLLDNVRVAVPSALPHDVRAGLARFRVHGAGVERIAGTLSGGERLRVCLACLLLAERPPQLLLLDEPTNNLDLASVEHLVEALAGYRGALLVASHDRRFLGDIGTEREWSVVDLGLPTEVRM